MTLPAELLPHKRHIVSKKRKNCKIFLGTNPLLQFISTISADSRSGLSCRRRMPPVKLVLKDLIKGVLGKDYELETEIGPSNGDFG